MVGRGRHQCNEINAALKTIRKINSAFTVEEDHNGHRWGWITCDCGDAPFSIHSTPRNPGGHAKQIQKWTARHAVCWTDDQEETP